ncbi:unnamed protein product [Didymodactylos carnosus]|uniref:RING-type E3 ubiquitin transferase n=1 Tax=Didymodactylos carnosus TaxID=1234261 RepID=A0A814JJH1_9BILA|nr:unnamed protein product [Didymodactylos carnosus]CAF1038877.1 unnamed protein product [Didymodactylos carnosus]CAF3643040.1 unnamed protein product [Didymodactylos carnosus]CAF3809282.1 unnamed protein product [Didymodactylos carnosus]
MSSERSISPDPIVERPGKSRSGGYRENQDGPPFQGGAASLPPQQSSRAPKRYREMSGSRSRSRSITRSRSPSLSHSGTRSPRSVSPDHLATKTSSRTGINNVSTIEGATAASSKHRHEHSSSSKKKKSKRRSGSAELERYDCGICLENVPNSKRLFGILDNCDHVFCYECIVGWKRSKYSNHESARSCPVCKTRSSFITPSKHWFENKDDKYKIVKKHKNHLKTLPCRYYLRHGFCRFSDRCLYDHHEAARQYRQQHGSGGNSHHEYHRSHYYSQRSPSPREYRRREHRERVY